MVQGQGKAHNREAVINVMVHSDYSLGGAPIHIAILDDRIELQNPGLLEEIALKFCATFFTQRTRVPYSFLSLSRRRITFAGMAII